ncbi:charged multivesicular body protein 6-A [Onthophagus taurus]|uniref:charged multivesicular body protein 6-A n=1 Tax=Onthophagus taurus TaxID=166361 RepID=UPI000C200142|nr:charged multivesicular body protein 6-A [Onthophagus taurus]
MGLIFSKKKAPSRITEQDKAVLQLKQQRDKIKQYQKRIEGLLEKDRLLAKKLLNNGQKERAKLLLRKKRYQEQLLERADGQLQNLEKMTHDIEFAQIEIQVVNGLKQGNEALKKLNEAMSIDEIEKILDETREGVEKQQEINDLLSGVLTQDDEDAVLAEFDAMVADELPTIDDVKDPGVLELPDVPEDEIEVKKQKKMKEKVALEA